MIIAFISINITPLDTSLETLYASPLYIYARIYKSVYILICNL